MSDRDTLAAAQRSLVDALVAGAPDPAGFDTGRVAAVRTALLRKRAGEVAKAWPVTAAAYGDRWHAEFAAWAGGRPPGGSLADGFGFAEAAEAAGTLPAVAAGELAEMRLRFRVRPDGHVHRRRGLAVGRVGGALAVGLGGRVRWLSRPG